MTTKFSEDVIPLSDLKASPGRIVSRIAKTRRPALLTSRGRGVAVVQDIGEFERIEEERELMRAVVQGLCDLETGQEVPLAEAKKRLGIE